MTEQTSKIAVRGLYKRFGTKRGVNPYDKQTLMEERPVRELARRIERDQPAGRHHGGGDEDQKVGVLAE